MVCGGGESGDGVDTKTCQEERCAVAAAMPVKKCPQFYLLSPFIKSQSPRVRDITDLLCRTDALATQQQTQKLLSHMHSFHRWCKKGTNKENEKKKREITKSKLFAATKTERRRGSGWRG